jgi:PqqD family protein of HPr-rel-A system
MQRLRSLALNPDGFAFDPTTGESFTLNTTGLVVLEGLREGSSALEIVGRLSEEFDVSENDATRDVDDFMDHLRSLRLI